MTRVLFLADVDCRVLFWQNESYMKGNPAIFSTKTISVYTATVKRMRIMADRWGNLRLNQTLMLDNLLLFWRFAYWSDEGTWSPLLLVDMYTLAVYQLCYKQQQAM